MNGVDMDEMEYAGFWIRVGASLIDTVLLLLVVGPILSMIYGEAYWAGKSTGNGSWEFIFNYIFPAVVVILFWVYKSATPGKMMLHLSIVDAETGGKPSTGQLIGRYLGYYVSALPLLLGMFWVGIDKKKQGWHDKLAGTLVIKNKR